MKEEPLTIILYSMLIGLGLGMVVGIMVLLNTQPYKILNRNGNGYYYINKDCWAYAPNSTKALEEAKKDCE